MEEEYREIELIGTQLRVYPNGNIWRLCKGGGGYKKGEWVICNPVYSPDGYVRIRLRNKTQFKTILAHRIIGYVYLNLDIDDPTQQIDHINRLKCDNRVDNLNIVNNYQNNLNKDYSGCSGVHMRGGKYRASIQRNNKKRSLGTFNTWEEAHMKYLEEQSK